ncbi:MAG: hypothetical protein IJU35_07520 [Paludibacteraceae bacterium]|nr:hypothetical protein [Paludibacteraceae bacterium]
MAVVSRDQIKSWFRKGLKPLEAHFTSWIDSFWHKNDAIPMSSINGLNEALNQRTISIDDALNDSSANPVQNRVVKQALEGKAAVDHNHDADYAAKNHNHEGQYQPAGDYASKNPSHISISETINITTVTTGKNTGTTTTADVDITFNDMAALPFDDPASQFTEDDDNYLKAQQCGLWNCYIDDLQVNTTETVDNATTQNSQQYGGFAALFITTRDQNGTLTQRICAQQGINIDGKTYLYQRTAEEGAENEKRYLRFTQWTRVQENADTKTDGIEVALRQLITDAPKQYYDLYYYINVGGSSGEDIRDIENFDDATIRWNLSELPNESSALLANYERGIYRIRLCKSTGVTQNVVNKRNGGDDSHKDIMGIAFVSKNSYTDTGSIVTLLIDTGTNYGSGGVITPSKFSVFQINTTAANLDSDLSDKWKYISNPWGIEAAPANNVMLREDPEQAGDEHEIEVSYDGGNTWEHLFTVYDGDDGAPGESGTDGADGADGHDGVDGLTPEFDVVDNGGSYTLRMKYTEETDWIDLFTVSDGQDGDTIALRTNAEYDQQNTSMRLDSQLDVAAIANIFMNPSTNPLSIKLVLNIGTTVDGNDIALAMCHADLSFGGYADMQTGNFVLYMYLSIPSLKGVISTEYRATCNFTAAEYQTVMEGTAEEKQAVLENKTFTDFIAV